MAYKARSKTGLTTYITRQSQVERTMVYLASFPDLNPHPVLEFNSLGKLTFCNKAAVDLADELGLSADMNQFLPEDYYQLFKTTDNEKCFYRKIQIENMIFAESIHLLPSFDVLRIYAYEVSEYKYAEARLVESEEKFSKAFRCNPDLMALSSLEEGRYIDVNDAFYKITGYNSSEVIGHTAAELGIWADPGHRNTLVKLLKENGNIRDFELQLRLKSGEIRDFSLSGEILNIAGNLHLLNTSRDITERKRLEKEMARLDRLNLIGEMAASIGHEIRNPLTAVRGFLQLLWGQDESVENRLHYELVIEELDRANGIITEFLSMARNKAVDLHPRHLNLIIKDIVPMIQAEALMKGINIKLDLGKLPRIKLDGKEIRQLILNMCRNGLEAMATGKNLTIGTLEMKDEVMLYIQDQGSGIPTTFIDKIGTPFASTKANRTGLGLAICYSIAARHGAVLDFDTGAKGTTFKVFFPKIIP